MHSTVQSWLLRLNPELSHRVGITAGRFAQALAPGAISRKFAFSSPVLEQSLVGMSFENPVGLAAGCDKNAQLLRFWEELGFGYVEAGSVTARPSRGNKRPRLFRLSQDQAIINRLGLPNQGAKRIRKRVSKTRMNMPLGISIAKTHDPTITGDAAIEDYRQSFALMAPEADYVAMNISCPNTSDGKTFEEPRSLERLLDVIFAERARLNLEVPVLLKISPIVSSNVVWDTRVDEIIFIGKTYGVAGYVAANTATDRAGLQTNEQELQSIGAGGLSGPPLFTRAMALVSYLYDRLDGSTPIIGVGGIASGEAAYSMLRAGASLVQLYTGIVYEGPGLIRQIKMDLVDRCERDGLSSISEAIGAGIDVHQKVF